MTQSASPSTGNPIDRNKAIVWARYLLDSHDWLLFATRVTRVNAETGPFTSPIKLMSLSLLSPSGKVIYETMLKPQDMIPSGLLNDHGLDYSVIFNAQPFNEIAFSLSKLINGKQMLAWDLNAQQSLFDQLCTQYAQPPVPFAGYSLRPEFSRYIGEFDANLGNYKPQHLKVEGPSATHECRAMLHTLTTMASSSQNRDTAPTGHQGWTGEFYKPKVGAKDKIKDFLGL